MLKVFLLDEQNRVRNIYSTGLMSPDLVMNDVRTLAAARYGAGNASVAHCISCCRSE